LAERRLARIDDLWARIDDLWEGDRVDLTHYLAIAAEVGAGSVLDVGCGTGNWACMLASAALRLSGWARLWPHWTQPRASQARGGAMGEYSDVRSLPALAVDLGGPRMPGRPGAREGIAGKPPHCRNYSSGATKANARGTGKGGQQGATALRLSTRPGHGNYWKISLTALPLAVAGGARR
jgi:hypothetical protein